MRRFHPATWVVLKLRYSAALCLLVPPSYEQHHRRGHVISDGHHDTLFPSPFVPNTVDWPSSGTVLHLATKSETKPLEQRSKKRICTFKTDGRNKVFLPSQIKLFVTSKNSIWLISLSGNKCIFSMSRRTNVVHFFLYSLFSVHSCLVFMHDSKFPWRQSVGFHQPSMFIVTLWGLCKHKLDISSFALSLLMPYSMKYHFLQ